jgi:Protein of unknown function (DUF664)
MPDQKPPRLESGERETLRALLQYQRDSLVRKVAGLDEQVAGSSPVATGTNLFWLIKHVARAESLWVLRRFAGDIYRRTCEQVDGVVDAAPSLEESCRDVGDEAPVNLRWVLMHLLEETARHAGHADILRELIDGQTGR